MKWSLLELLIRLRREGKRVVGYGAPGQGEHPAQLLRHPHRSARASRSTETRTSTGKFLPGTHIPIYPPDTIDETRPDYILILPWNLQHEIAAQLAYMRDWGAQLIVPIPTPGDPALAGDGGSGLR